MALLFLVAAKGATVAQYKMRQQRERSAVILPVDEDSLAGPSSAASSDQWWGNRDADPRPVLLANTAGAGQAQPVDVLNIVPTPRRTPPSSTSALVSAPTTAAPAPVPKPKYALNPTPEPPEEQPRGEELCPLPKRTASLPVSVAQGRPVEQPKRSSGQGSVSRVVDDGSFNYVRRTASDRAYSDAPVPPRKPSVPAVPLLREENSGGPAATAACRSGHVTASSNSAPSKSLDTVTDDGSFNSVLRRQSVSQCTPLPVTGSATSTTTRVTSKPLRQVARSSASHDKGGSAPKSNGYPVPRGCPAQIPNSALPPVPVQSPALAAGSLSNIHSERFSGGMHGEPGSSAVVDVAVVQDPTASRAQLPARPHVLGSFNAARASSKNS
jgi:hypothetical protein